VEKTMKINLKDRKIRVKGYSISALLLIILAASAGIVFAVAYVTLQWTSTASVVANPKVCFVQWSDSSKQNSFDYAVNIFPSIKTVDENITHGIWNWDSSTHTVSMRIYSITNQATNIQSVTTYVKTIDGGTTKITVTFTDGGSLPTTYLSFTADATTKYLIWTEITAKSGATGSSIITYDLKVENP
jgi:hypothetical protein